MAVTSANILDASQPGLRLGPSIKTALGALKDDLLMAMDAGKISMLRLLDPFAAFDTVDHKALTYLHDTGEVAIPAVPWPKSVLSSRTQRGGG